MGGGGGGEDPDVGMTQIPVQQMRHLAERYSADELNQLAEYYGSHPTSLEGFAWVKNAEGADFIAAVTESEQDLSRCQPVRANVPYVVCLLEGKYKVRAIIDSGSTTTIISSGLAEKVKGLERKVHPTKLSFLGVNEATYNYCGLIRGLKMQLTPKIQVEVNAAVVENSDPLMLIGQDVLGGSRSKLKTVGLNTDYNYYTLVDEATGSIDNLHYLKNVEVTALPNPLTLMAEALGEVKNVDTSSQVVELFRR